MVDRKTKSGLLLATINVKGGGKAGLGLQPSAHVSDHKYTGYSRPLFEDGHSVLHIGHDSGPD